MKRKLSTIIFRLGTCGIILTLSSCLFKPIHQDFPKKNITYRRSHILPVFMDGTCNKPNDSVIKNTNVYKLKTMTKPDIQSYYIEGVGNNGKFLGMGLGVGTSKRVRYAYMYLDSIYKPGDTICLFGFSRGAYSCRILSNLIYVAGLPDLSNIHSKKMKKRIIRKIYNNYRGNKGSAERKHDVANVIEKWNKHERNINHQITINQSEPINISIMGLFDSVEALAAPDYNEDDFAFPNKNHLNQVANVNKVYHALSLDDNRAQIFTPILLTSDDVKQNSNCKDISKTVEEVWFSGSHLDIGGGHPTNPEIRNNTLKWMIANTKDYNLFDNDSTIVESPFLDVHNMQHDLVWKMLYKKKNRDISRYYITNQNIYPKLKIHESVIKRLEEGCMPDFKIFKKDTLDWFDKTPFKDCFEKDTSDTRKRIFNKEKCKCIEVVKTN